MSIPESWLEMSTKAKLQDILNVDEVLWLAASNQARNGYIEHTIVRNKKSRKLCYPSPKSELNTLQKAIKKKILIRLETHPAICGYLVGNHNINVSSKASGFTYVGKVDIRNFHPSISKSNVANALHKHGISPGWSRLIAKICTYRGRLPQGACTSNHIANLVLDVIIRRHLDVFCAKRRVRLVNYGDDIAVCGNYQMEVIQCVNYIKKQLRKYGFEPNELKCNDGEHQGKPRLFIGCSTSRTQPDYPRVKQRALRRELRMLKYRIQNGEILTLDSALLKTLKFRIAYVKRINEVKAKKLHQCYRSLCAVIKKNNILQVI